MAAFSMFAAPLEWIKRGLHIGRIAAISAAVESGSEQREKL